MTWKKKWAIKKMDGANSSKWMDVRSIVDIMKLWVNLEVNFVNNIRHLWLI